MATTYMVPLITKPVLITAPGLYRTRCGEVVTVRMPSPRHDFACWGAYANGCREGWHKSGRLYAGMECCNDIVARVEG